MCGIIAVLRRPSSRPSPDLASIGHRLEDGIARLGAAVAAFDGCAGSNDAELSAIAELLEAVDLELRGPPGVACLLSLPVPQLDGVAQVSAYGATLAALADDLEAALDAGKGLGSPVQLEEVNAVLVRLRDVIWALGRDRPDTARAIAGLARWAVDVDGALPRAALDAFWSIQVALSAIDRLEVRGRDSAGLHLLIDWPWDRFSPAARSRPCSAPVPATRFSPRWRCAPRSGT